MLIDEDLILYLAPYGRVVPFNPERRHALREEWSLKSLAEPPTPDNVRQWVDVVTPKFAERLFPGVAPLLTLYQTVVIKQTPAEWTFGYDKATIVRRAALLIKHSAKMKDEAEAMMACQGPYVAKIWAHGPLARHIYLGEKMAFECNGYGLAMKHYTEGDLFEFTTGRIQTFPLEKRAAFMYYATYMLMRALYTVHKAGFLHCDVKPENVFMESGRMYLGDFGFSVTQEKAAAETRSEGTIGYMAPEVAYMHDSFKIRLRRYERMLYNGASAEALSSIKQRMQQIPKGITKSSDIFALGVSMHSVFCQSSLVQYNDEFTIVYMGLCLHQQKIYERTKQRIPSGIRDIVTRMIQIDPASRGNLDELVELIEKRIPQTEQELTREAQTIE